jgi:hypothetical protein
VSLEPSGVYCWLLAILPLVNFPLSSPQQHLIHDCPCADTTLPVLTLCYLFLLCLPPILMASNLSTPPSHPLSQSVTKNSFLGLTLWQQCAIAFGYLEVCLWTLILHGPMQHGTCPTCAGYTRATGTIVVAAYGQQLLPSPLLHPEPM